MSLTALDFFPQITTNNGRVAVKCKKILTMQAVTPREEHREDRWLLDSGCEVFESPHDHDSFVVTMPEGATITPIMLGGKIPYAVVTADRNTHFTIARQYGSRRRQLRCFSTDLLRQFIAKYAACNGIEAVPTLTRLGI